jgi:hypothetical protein
MPTSNKAIVFFWGDGVFLGFFCVIFVFSYFLSLFVVFFCHFLWTRPVAGFLFSWLFGLEK